MTFFDPLGEALGKIGLVDQLPEVYRQCVRECSHPVIGHHFDRAPRPERARVKALRETDELRSFTFEMLTQFLQVAELLVIEQELGADITERARQLVMVRIATRETVIVDKYP